MEATQQAINPLKNERVILRYIKKPYGIWGDDPRHVLAGGMAENVTRTFVVPILESGHYKKILDDDEQEFLEGALGLESGALSFLRQTDNFWDDSNKLGINKVSLHKADNYFDLSEPADYIKYKILLANSDFIAPSLTFLEDHPKTTYQFVIINEGAEEKQNKVRMTSTMECYKEYGKIENDKDKLRTIIESIEGRPTSPRSKLETLQTKCNDLIQNDSKKFLSVITDKYLGTKTLIRKALEASILSRRGDFYYLRKDNTPLCEAGEEPVLSNAAHYLNDPRHQDIKFAIEEALQK